MDNAAGDTARDLRLDLLQSFGGFGLLARLDADSTALMKDRMRLTREWLIVSRVAFRRMRFLACGVFAIVVL